MNEAQLQRQANIVRQCLRAAFLRNDPWAARDYRRALSETEETLAGLRQARLITQAKQEAFENEPNPSLRFVSPLAIEVKCDRQPAIFGCRWTRPILLTHSTPGVAYLP